MFVILVMYVVVRLVTFLFVMFPAAGINLPKSLPLLPFFGFWLVSALAIWITIFRAMHHARAFLSQNQFQGIPRDRLLLVGEQGDEAAAYLAAFQLCTWALNKIITLMEAAADAFQLWLERSRDKPNSLRLLLPNLLIYAGAIGYVILLIPSLREGPFHLPQWIVSSAMVSLIAVLTISMAKKRIVALALAKLLYLALATITFAIACALLVPFWFIATLFVPMRDMTLTALYVDIGVQVVPGKGTWTLHQYVPQAKYLRGLALAHSAAHDDSQVGPSWRPGSKTQ